MGIEALILSALVSVVSEELLESIGNYTNKERYPKINSVENLLRRFQVASSS